MRSHGPDLTEEEIKANELQLEEAAQFILDAFPGMGFCLMVFPFGPPDGKLNYISNARREDMIPTLKAWIADAEGRMMAGTKTHH